MSGSSDSSMASDICSQIQSVFSSSSSSSSSPSPLDVLLRELSAAAASSSKIFVHGVGREGLMLRGLCMRLCHLGLPAHAVGDVTAPPIASSDLLLSSAGPGGFSTVDAIAGVAKSAGARVVLLTAHPGAGRGASSVADAVVHLPARTMADGEEEEELEEAVRLPMGSLYEGAMFVLFEMVVLKLAELLGQSPAQMRSRHTNLE
ncbi:putative 3-hexulose-6-phosphate isomerase [Iris pallida]|uniref:3-hexulose-6-phosphate isomerase n=1 Tax=Iris pallida TaxID=29817 RepID=A0AAX6EVI3_IRIPA|nr:putative 3-hexulose-6-phosphate isomerase [Iris pallida]